jgi:hypothetical protein
LLLGKIQEDIGRKEPEAIAFVFQIHEITCMYYNGVKKKKDQAAIPPVVGGQIHR